MFSVACIAATSGRSTTVVGGPTKEKTTVDFLGRTGADYSTGAAGKGFVISSDGGTRRGFWFDVSTGETEPDFSAQGATTYTAITALVSDDGAALAAALTAQSAALGWVVTDLGGGVVQFEDDATGTRTDAVDVDAGVTITVVTQGS